MEEGYIHCSLHASREHWRITLPGAIAVENFQIAEKEKKRKYLEALLQQQRQFSHFFVFFRWNTWGVGGVSRAKKITLPVQWYWHSGFLCY